MRPWSVFARLARLAAALPLAAGAAAAEPLLAPYSTSPELQIEMRDAGGTPGLRLRGNWPTPCLPTVEDLSLEGSDLRIELRSKKPLCARASMPFDLSVDLERLLGKHWPQEPLRVSVSAANSATAAAQLRGFALLAPQPARRALPAAGFWWPLPEADTSNPMAGTGFSLEIQGNTLAVAVLGRTGSGSPIWYFGTGKLQGNISEIDLVAADSGDPADKRSGGDSAVLALEFQGGGRAHAWLGHYEQGDNQPMLRQQAMALAHLPFAERTDGSAWQGDWVLLGATPGQPRSARQLRLSASSFIAVANYRISADDGSVLSCERAVEAPRSSPPQRCRLNDANGQLVAEFDSVDINRLDGHAPDRTPVQLLRADKR